MNKFNDDTLIDVLFQGLIASLAYAVSVLIGTAIIAIYYKYVFLKVLAWLP